MLKDYVKFGLMHWGSDAQGVENTRRFLLEWLSFLCRYVPVGLLERLPARLNDRPPIYHGRSDLETLMASRYVGDWLKLAEMLLGPARPGFDFQPCVCVLRFCVRACMCNYAKQWQRLPHVHRAARPTPAHPRPPSLSLSLWLSLALSRSLCAESTARTRIPMLVATRRTASLLARMVRPALPLLPPPR